MVDAHVPTTVPPGARCSFHVEEPAGAVCPRCGDYTCAACAPDAASGVCLRCRDRGAGGGVPFDAGSWTVGGVLRHSQSALMNDLGPTLGVLWLALVPYYVIVSGPPMAMGVLAPEWAQTLMGRVTAQGVGILTMCLASPALLGAYAYSAARVRGERATLSLLFSRFDRVPGFVPLALLVTLLGLPTALWVPETVDPTAGDPLVMLSKLGSLYAHSLLVSAYGMLIFTVVGFAMVELAVGESRSGVVAFRTAMGHLGRRPVAAIATGLLLDLIVMFSIMCCFLPAIFGLPYTTLAYTTLYLSMRAPAREAGAT